jgi:hypothetical protein
MSLFGFLKKKPAPLLAVKVNGADVCVVAIEDLPCEKKPSVQIQPGSTVSFVASDGTEHRHDLGQLHGWVHLSVRVHENRACQADCVVSASEKFDPEEFVRGEAAGIRFQPFFLPGSNVSNAEFIGKGLFARGLHFSGNVTRGNTLLSCECDACHRSFLIQSYHAGFSNAGYFYSGSGRYTLVVDSAIAGAPAALSDPDPTALAALEERLPKAPDGTSFSYLNPFRCPHCAAAYIDFRHHPDARKSEYYGNYFAGAELLRYAPAESTA